MSEEIIRRLRDLDRRLEQLEMREISHPLDKFIVPSSLTVVTGGTPVGTITDIQTLLDGNVYNLPEVTGTPGYDLELDFTNVGAIYGIVSRLRYAGLASHDVTFTLHNYDTVADDEFHLIASTSTEYQYRTILIPDGAPYVDAGFNAQASIIHTSAGNAAHDLYVDYVALIGVSKT